MAEKKKKSGTAPAKKAATASEAITKDSIIGEVVNRYPQAVQVFFKHGLMCIGCGFAMMETIEQGTMGHGIPLSPLLKDLNEAVKKSAKG